MLYILKNCKKCGGDLVLEDEDEWRCLHCSRNVYRGPGGGVVEPPSLGIMSPLRLSAESYQRLGEGPVSLKTNFGALDHSALAQESDHPQRNRRGGYKPRSPRSIDASIRARKLGESNWWARNRQTVDYLDQGLSVREISHLTSRTPRQIRTVRERLADLRAVA